MPSVNMLISLVCLCTLGVAGTSSQNGRKSFGNTAFASKAVALQAVQDQQPQIYRHTTPTFSFSIPSGWEEYANTPTPGVYLKLWRFVDGVYTGSGIRISGAPAGKLASVWDLNAEIEKNGFEMEFAVRNFRWDKVTVGQRKAIRYEFDSQLTIDGKLAPIKMVGHSFLVKQPSGDFVVHASLLSRVYDITGDNAGYMSVVNSLDFD